jgi:hypothetical protein
MKNFICGPPQAASVAGYRKGRISGGRSNIPDGDGCTNNVFTRGARRWREAWED